MVFAKLDGVQSSAACAQHFILATAGHVDHGKSALVKALTGTDPDRLPEEKARGITIDLGFAHLELPPCRLGIVDVPGHEDFVKNMVAGVGSIDLALLVVAADDRWMPQTEEHLQILAYLGVSRAVVALTKVDLVEPDEAGAVEEIRARLRGTPFADAPIVPTSTLSGRGLAELKSALTRVLADTPPPRDIGKPRLPIDRVFSLRGIGTVVTGTLTGGVLRRGHNVVIQPSGLATRIRNIQSHNRDVDQAGPGRRTALNLPDLAVEQLHRGHVVTLPELGPVTDTLDVLLERSARLPPSTRPLKDGLRARLHLGSGNAPARVQFLDCETLAAGGRALAQLRCETPVFAFAGDRFILRDWPEQTTLAGGVVLDPAGAREFARSGERLNLLQRRASSFEVETFVVTELVRNKAIRRERLLVQSRFASAEIEQAVRRLIAAGHAVATGEWLAGTVWWRELLSNAGANIDAEHRAHPERVGLALTELRAALEPKLPLPETFEALIAELCRKDFVRVGAAIKRASHRPTLPAQLRSAGERLRAALSAKPIDPPSRKELTPDAVSQQALRFLLDTGEATELSADTVMLTEHYARATAMVKAHLQQKPGGATPSELRQLLNTSRRVVIPLLERLDREGVTLRQGDRRLLRPRPQMQRSV
jgi:selenocysteine-specific elongation factor